MTEKQAFILRELYTGSMQPKRTYTFFYRPETKAGLRDYAAAKELEKAGLASLVPGNNPNMWRIESR